MNSEEFSKWVSEHGTGHIESQYINGIDYRLVTMTDGWIAIFEWDDGMYLPRTQAFDMAHALSWCAMRECVHVPIQPIGHTGKKRLIYK